jgi:hypothetical protein
VADLKFGGLHMNYWLDLFTGTTWEEFLKAGANVSGFTHRMRRTVEHIQVGDILLCYLTGVMRWVGALKVIGPSKNRSRIWKDADFPARLDVEPIIILPPEHGVPMGILEGRVAFYEGPLDAGKFKAFLRGSPRQFVRAEDGELIVRLLHDAKEHPIARPVDPRKLAYRPFFLMEQRRGKKTIKTIVSVPDAELDEEYKPVIAEDVVTSSEAVSKHTEIQYHLLALGAEMGFDVWVARNDRGKTWNNRPLGEMAGMVVKLPTQFNEATNRTIELIDVLWIKSNAIIAAFEVESTTSIYSGLLRMSDLLALQPNLEINLFLVAPDERRVKVEQEILRPTFKLREKPLAGVCGFLSFSTLLEKVDGIRRLGLAASLKADFLEKTAEYFVNDNIDKV